MEQNSGSVKTRNKKTKKLVKKTINQEQFSSQVRNFSTFFFKYCVDYIFHFIQELSLSFFCSARSMTIYPVDTERQSFIFLLNPCSVFFFQIFFSFFSFNVVHQVLDFLCFGESIYTCGFHS